MTLSNPASPWDRFALELRRDVAVWALIMLWLSAYRVFMAWPELVQLPAAQVLAALWTGMRFDSVIATIVVIPTLAVAGVFLLAKRNLELGRMRTVTVCLFFCVTAIVYAANLQFFKVFGTQLDQRVLAVLDDGDGAVRATIWQAHQPVFATAMAVIFGGLAIWSTLFASRLVKPGRPASLSKFPLRVVFCVALIGLIVGLVRGFSWGVTPIRIKFSYVSSSMTVNRLIPSPYAFWLRAMEDLRYDISAPSAEELSQALDVHDLAIGQKTSSELDIGQRLQQIAPGSDSRPAHIFLILMEGQHGFPLLAKYRAWNLYPGLAAIADEGASFENFLPSGRHTDRTVGALVAGTLTPHFVIFGVTEAQREFPTSIAPQFERMGYYTRFFYGGYAGWSRLEEFIVPQGFDRLHTAGELLGKPGNAWGVWDGELLDDVLAKVDPSKPSFNFILTTNNHSPFDVDEKLLPQLSNLPPEARDWDEHTRLVLRHEMYAEQQVSRFIKEANRRFPNSIFVVTGDHTAYGTHYVLPGASALDMMTVPLIFYGDALPPEWRGRHLRPASHLDIVPTLFDLSAPRGMAYSAVGHNLFAPGGASHAIGENQVLIDGWLANADDPDLVPLSSPPAPKPPAAVLDLARRHHAAIRTISRGLIMPPAAATH